MAVTGNWGGNAVTTKFSSAVKLGITLASNEYPNGAVSVNISSSASPRRAWFGQAGDSLNFYLCDSNKNNKIKLFTVTGFPAASQFIFTPNSTTINNTNKLLKGKALYVCATGNTSTVGTYGPITITINTNVETYTLTLNANPAAGGTVSGGGSYASGTAHTIIATPASLYEFVNWTNTGGTIANATASVTTITMPSANVTATANFRLASGKSTPSLSETSFYGGDTIQLTISATQQTYTHKYRLYFGPGMDTGEINISAGVTSVNIYIPVEWSLHLAKGTTSKTDGILYLTTFDGNTDLGYNAIYNLTYIAKSNTVPNIVLYRVDNLGNACIYGKYGWYEITVPSGLTSYKITYNSTDNISPPASGFILPEETLLLSLSQNHLVTLTMTNGTEIITITKDVPKVMITEKAFQ